MCAARCRLAGYDARQYAHWERNALDVAARHAIGKYCLLARDTSRNSISLLIVLAAIRIVDGRIRTGAIRRGYTSLFNDFIQETPDAFSVNWDAAAPTRVANSFNGVSNFAIACLAVMLVVI